MEINDYSQRLAASRDQFQNGLDRLRSSYKKDLESLEKKHDLQESKQRQTYDQGISKLEGAQQDYVRQSSDKTKEMLEQKQSHFMKGLDRAQTDYDERRAKLSSDYADKLKNIQGSYNESLSSNKEYNDKRFGYLNEKYNSTMDKQANNFNSSIGKQNEDARQELRQNVLKSNDEKTHLINKHHTNIKSITEENNDRFSNQKKLYEDSIEGLRKNHQENELSNESHRRATIEDIKNKYDTNLIKQADTFKSLSSNLSDKMVHEKKKLGTNNTQRTAELEERFRRDMIDFKRSQERVSDQTIDTNDDEIRLNRLSNGYEKRIANLRNQIDELNTKSSVQSKDASLAHQKAMRDKVYTLNRVMDSKQREHADYTKDLTEKSKNEKDIILDDVRARIELNTNVHEDRLVNERRGSQKIIDNQKKVFGTTVNAMTSKNSETIKDLQNEFQKEKSQFFEQTKLDFYNDSEKMKDFYKNKINTQSESYEQKLEQELALRTKIEEQYEKQLSELSSSAAKALRAQKNAEEQRRIDDKRAEQRGIAAREREWQQRFIALKGNFDKKLAHTKFQNDIQVTKLTRRHNDEMERILSEHTREMQLKLKEAQEQYVRLAQDSEIRLDALKNQYEMKLEKMKISNMSEVAKKGMA